MSKILADTSVWIDSLHNKDLPHVWALKESLKDANVCCCPTIVQEVLQGIRDDLSYQLLKEQFLQLEIFISEQLYMAIETAQLYRYLRKKGVTIRKPNDCIIAWYAINNKVKLLHSDSDFDLIAQHTELKIVKL